MKETIESSIYIDSIREFGLKLMEQVPEYFYSVPASSSGKYHPENDLGEGGLVRHSISVMKMLDHLMVPDGERNLTNDQKDLLRIAALFHDCLKSGTQSCWEENPHTKFLHPVYSASFILIQSVENSFPYESAKYIADAIISHMGQWNTSNKESGTLPKPKTYEQRLLHMADYLASRKDINMTLTE